MSYRRLAGALLLAVTAAACDSDATAPDTLAGTWILAEIHGQSLPAFLTAPDVPGVDGYRSEYIASTLVVRSDNTFSYTLHKRMEWPLNVWTDVHTEATGTVHRIQTGGQTHIQLRQSIPLPGGQPMEGLFAHVEVRSDGRLVLLAETDDMVYRRS
jgi:hypothetical protein